MNVENNLAPARKLFDNARAYSDAVQRLCSSTEGNRRSKNKYFSHSVAIYAGLALEYYLKTLYFLENMTEIDERGKTPHNFYALFLALKPKTRKTLEYQFYTVLSKRDMTDITSFEANTGIQLPRELSETLHFWTESFLQLRINTTPTDTTKLFFFPEMEEIFMDTLLAQNPQWRNHALKGSQMRSLEW